MDLVTLAVANALGGNGGGGSSLPTDPAQDGTYNLQNTVSSGTGTLSWASGSSGGGVLVVHETISEGTHTLDKTWKEISDAANAGTIIYFISQTEGDEGYIMYAQRIMYDGVAYCSYFSSISATVYAAFESETENGYPSYTE